MNFKLKHLTFILAILLTVSVWHNSTKGMSYSEAFHVLEQIAVINMGEDYIMVTFKSETVSPSIQQIKALAKIADLKEGFYIE